MNCKRSLNFLTLQVRTVSNYNKLFIKINFNFTELNKFINLIYIGKQNYLRFN